MNLLSFITLFPLCEFNLYLLCAIANEEISLRMKLFMNILQMISELLTSSVVVVFVMLTNYS